MYLPCCGDTVAGDDSAGSRQGETGCTITASDGARKRETKELEGGRFGPVVSHGQSPPLPDDVLGWVTK